MNNIFKVNSRFSSLMEERQDKQSNSESSVNKGNDNVYGERMNNRFKTTVNERKSKFVGDKKKQSILLTDVNFPTLTPNNGKTPNNDKIQLEKINSGYKRYRTRYKKFGRNYFTWMVGNET